MPSTHATVVLNDPLWTECKLGRGPGIELAAKPTAASAITVLQQRSKKLLRNRHRRKQWKESSHFVAFLGSSCETNVNKGIAFFRQRSGDVKAGTAGLAMQRVLAMVVKVSLFLGSIICLGTMAACLQASIWLIK